MTANEINKNKQRKITDIKNAKTSKQNVDTN